MAHDVSEKPGDGIERRGTGGWDNVLADEAYAVTPGSEWRSELYRVASAQFHRAADAIGLRRRPARAPHGAAPLARRQLPGAPRRRRGPGVHGLPRPAHARHGPDEGRHPPRARRLARRVRGARDVDDLQVRAPRPAVRRREGRRALRPEPALRRRDRAPHAPLHGRDRRRSSAPTATSARPTWRRASARCRGSWTPTRRAWGRRCPRSSPASPSSSAAPRAGAPRPAWASSSRSSRCSSTSTGTSSGKKVVVQGVGNVGATVALELERRGAKIVGARRRRGRSPQRRGHRHRKALRAPGREPLHPRLRRRGRDRQDRSPRGAVRHPRPGRARVPDHRPERGQARHEARSSRARTARRRPRRTRSSPSGASPWCRTSSPTRAA